MNGELLRLDLGMVVSCFAFLGAQPLPAYPYEFQLMAPGTLRLEP